MEDFKAFEEITEADARMRSWALVDRVTGNARPYGLRDLHGAIAEIRLNPAVPAHVQMSFLTARHLALYAWFVYRFAEPSRLQAYASLEFALRDRLGHSNDDKPPPLRNLLEKAVADGMFNERGIGDWPGHRQDLTVGGTREYRSGDWIRSLPEFIAYFRNDLAHGSFTLNPDGALTLRLVAELINQLYPAHDSAT